jgi:DNA polymerase-3 subunit alpha
MIGVLGNLFQSNKGEHQVSFEVLEVEKVKAKIEQPVPTAVVAVSSVSVDGDDLDNPDAEMLIEEEIVASAPQEVEQIKVVTKLSMPSRKLKIKISKELLQELDKMQLNYKLN